MATAAGRSWFDAMYGDGARSAGFCLTLVRDLLPEEALRRIGVTPWQAADPGAGSAAHPIEAYLADGGTALLERDGHAGTMVEVTRRLSAGTAMAAVSVGAAKDFVFAADGHLVTGFDPDHPGSRWGRDPDRLLPHMRDLGMLTDDGEAAGDSERSSVLASLALAERATGVRLTPEHLTGHPLTGSADHLY